MTSLVTGSQRRTLALLTAVAVVAALVFWTRGDAEAGDEPDATGIAAVYVALGTNFPDALGVGPLAAANGAPILLVQTNPPLPPPIVDELVRLNPESVVIVGGTSAISDEVQDAIELLLPNASVSRIAGGSRYETSAMLSESLFPITGYVSVPGIAFTSASPATDAVNLTPGAVYGSVVMYAEIHLPHGAEIVNLTALVTDTDGSDGIGVRLRRLTFNTDQIIADVFSGDAYSGGQTSLGDSDIPQYSVVDNDLFSYYLEIYASAANRSLIGVIVRYEVGAAG